MEFYENSSNKKCKFRQFKNHCFKKGVIVCSTCREEYGRWRHEHFYKIYILDRILQALPTSCEFMKNGCKVIQELSQITFHEENCEFRDVLCIFN